jgi:hypothetical protein
MWLFRGVTKNRWLNRRADDSAHVDAAARDISLRPGEDGLSLYRVDDEEDGKRVGTLFGVYKKQVRGRADHVDYILIPADSFTGLGLSVLPVPDPALGPELSERHHEVRGMTASLSRRLAAILLEEKRFQLGHVAKQDIDRAAADLPAPEG